MAGFLLIDFFFFWVSFIYCKFGFPFVFSFFILSKRLAITFITFLYASDINSSWLCFSSFLVNIFLICFPLTAFWDCSFLRFSLSLFEIDLWTFISCILRDSLFFLIYNLYYFIIYNIIIFNLIILFNDKYQLK